MESEKVKEIKKALEFNANEDIYVLPYVDDNDEQNIVDFNDILTLINELESENKSLQDLCNKTYEDLTKEIDRLEKEKTEQLKQFAERLKEEATRSIMNSDGEIVYVDYDFVITDDTDETLKEFIK